ncbi:MAG: polysaccharide biosynthesis/export family protein [Bacteroidales bacterium]|nr:polysaccharide biosynthesis/export family protein [Bacteroidales bacterium]
MPNPIYLKPKSTMSTWFKLLSIFLFSITLFSCVSQKQLTYLNDIDPVGNEQFPKLEQSEYRLQKQDVLYVKFTTLNEEINSSLNGSVGTNSQNMFLSEISIYMSGFAIDDSGYIKLPVVGLVKVLDKTLQEATIAIEDKASLYVKDATVVVKLLSFKVTLLGEINAPGRYANYKNQLTILEAIGMAGDITDFGDRSNVLVIRSTNSGTETFRINLQKKEILNSEDFLLVPNDIIIVESLKHKSFNLNAPVFSFFLGSMISTISLTLLLITIL